MNAQYQICASFVIDRFGIASFGQYNDDAPTSYFDEETLLLDFENCIFYFHGL
jgi:hypothetical protein